MNVFFGLILTAIAATANVELPVPYVAQAIKGNWVKPWDEACEEASIVMVNGYYSDRTEIDKDEAKVSMQSMFVWEDEVLKKNDDTNAEETLSVIREHGFFVASIKRNPTTEQIKAELDAKRPVIALLNSYDLYGDRDLGDSYHVLVVSGYDETKKEFIIQDPAREQHRYGYERLMNALHDYDAETDEASGPPTVLFTAPRPFGYFIIELFRGVWEFFRSLFFST